jgi:hypothetical protein
MTDRTPVLSPRRLKLKFQRLLKKFFIGPQPRNFMGNPIFSICCPQKVELDLACRDSTTTKRYYVETTHLIHSSCEVSFIGYYNYYHRQRRGYIFSYNIFLTTTMRIRFFFFSAGFPGMTTMFSNDILSRCDQNISKESSR